MNSFIKTWPNRFLLATLISILVLAPFVNSAFAESNGSGKEKIARQVAKNYIQIGTEQFRRGQYVSAEKTLLMAQDYQQYLTAAEREQLNELINKTHTAALGLSRIRDDVRKATKLFTSGNLAEAKKLLEDIKDSEFLTRQDAALVAKSLRKIDQQINLQKKHVAEAYNHSVELYDKGELEKARKGFARIAGNDLLIAPKGMTAEDYVKMIDAALAKKDEPQPESKPIEAITEDTTKSIVEELIKIATEPLIIEEKAIKKYPAVVVKKPKEILTLEGGYIEEINRKRNILRSHTNAVVNDSIAKANEHLSKDEFDKARQAIETAERVVNKNQLYLGDELFKQYGSKLKQLNEQTAKDKETRIQQLQEQKQHQAIKTQRLYREQMEADRAKRIGEIKDNARTYQKQQRYEEALGQLESLLAIDPQNNDALILKQTLEDTISFRKQLEVRKESNKEKVKTLIKSDESSIPYADDLTFPKNWREIVAKRKPEEAIGEVPANVAVYKQLEETVDISELTPETPFSEALRILRDAVEPPLQINVLWRDLYDNADIDKTTPINMDGIASVRADAALKMLLESVSGGFADIDYVVTGGLIKVATKDSLPPDMTTLVYNVIDLLGEPADFRSSLVGGRGGGGGGGAQDVGGGFTDTTQEQELDRDELEERALERVESLISLIQQTIEPDSWFEEGGEGSITAYESQKLIVRQTLAVHNQIKKLLKEIRKTLGNQVAIEARFLVVGENFLEDIGLDIDMFISPHTLSSKWALPISFEQRSNLNTQPTMTGIPGSLAESTLSAVEIQGSYGNFFIDDLAVSFLLRATQAHKDSKTLTAPKVTVMNGESATLRVQKIFLYAGNIEVDVSQAGTDELFQTFTVNYEDSSVTSGTILNITPTISHDQKNVILNITAELRDFLGFTTQQIQLPVFGGGQDLEYGIDFPETEVSRIQTRVSVPDGATLLLGGLKLTAEVEKESGVPILSKIPILGRMFSNRSKVKDHKILLILVKPTILLQAEQETEAIAAMESGF